MPAPLSRTRRTASPPSCSTLTSILPPGSVYFAAFVMRFTITCSNRVGSALTCTSSGDDETERPCARSSMSCWVVSTARATMLASRTRCLRSVILPCVIRATSSRSSMSRPSGSVPRPTRSSHGLPRAAAGAALGSVEARVVDRDRCLAGESYDDALGILGEDAGLGVTEEQPAQHARGTADDRDGKVARDRKMTMRHPVVRSVLAVARVLPHVVEPNDALPGERGCEQRGVAWCPEFLQGPAGRPALLEGRAGPSRQRVEQVVSALVVRRVVEECAELRAREDRRRVGHRLE